MSISTIEKPEDKREKLKRLREFHQSTFDDLGVPDAVFIPKMAYKPYGKTDMHIGLFTNEINKGEDIFVEFCSRDNDPEYEDRGLYRWKFNPHFDEEYSKTEPNEKTGHYRYLIPVEELVKVKSYIQKEEKELDLEDLPDPNVDLPLDQMTIRDLAAILLKKPISKRPWLNEIIKSV